MNLSLRRVRKRGTLLHPKKTGQPAGTNWNQMRAGITPQSTHIAIAPDGFFG